MVSRTLHGIAVFSCVAGAAFLLQGCARRSPSDSDRCKGFDLRFVTQSSYSDIKLSTTYLDAHSKYATKTMDATGIGKISVEDLTAYDAISIPALNASVSGCVLFAQNKDATFTDGPSGKSCTVNPSGHLDFIKAYVLFWENNATCEFKGDNAVFATRQVLGTPCYNITLDMGFTVDRSSLLFRSVFVRALVRSPLPRFKMMVNTEATVTVNITQATLEGPAPEDLDYKSWGAPCQPGTPRPQRVPDAILDILPPGLGGPARLALDSAFPRGMPHCPLHEQPPSLNEARSTAAVVV